MNLGTMVAEVRAALREPNSTSNTDRIYRNIRRAILHLQKEALQFLTCDFKLVTVANKRDYRLTSAIPQAVRYIDGHLWLNINADPDDRWRVVRRSPQWIEARGEGTAYTAYPEEFALRGDVLMFWPTPDAVHILDFHGIAKPPAPQSTLTAGVWKHEDDSFTNPWFEDGYDLVMEYAIYLGFSKDIGNMTEAQAALTRHLELLDSLRAQRSEAELGDGHFDPWPAYI